MDAKELIERLEEKIKIYSSNNLERVALGMIEAKAIATELLEKEREIAQEYAKQSKQDDVNDNPHLGYKTALVPDELLKPQPQEKVDVKSLAYEYAAEICYSGKANPEMTSEEVTKVFERAIANTIQDNELRMAAEKVVYEWHNSVGEECIDAAMVELVKALNQNKEDE
jgi:hypothetical protein